MGGGQRPASVDSRMRERRFRGGPDAGGVARTLTFRGAHRTRGRWILVPPAPPEGLDTILYEHDEREARADLRRQIAAMELALARLFGSAFPRKGIDFSVPGMGGPRLLSVDELERVRDGLAARIQEVRADLHDFAVVEEENRELIEEMTRRSRLAQVGSRLQRGHRRARLQELARQAALGPARHAARLVAGQDLLRLSR